MRIGLAGVGRIGAFHAETLMGLDAVDELVVTDLDVDAARAVAERLGATHAATVQNLLASGVDGVVVATGTAGHAPLVRQAVAAKVPTFCEKPLAATLTETVELAELVEASGVPVQVGFQRRFDRAYQRVAAAVRAGELGTVHTMRANTHDQSPPHPAYIPTSGGLFRDCSVHDFDAVRYVSGREVASVFATGANTGAAFFGEAGDVDTAAAVLTLDDGILVTVTATRYNGAGHDVRLEVMGSEGTLGVGFDDSLAVTSAEPGAAQPRGPRHRSFMERFLPAYRAELTHFAALARGDAPSPCTATDALQAFRVAEACELSRREQRVVTLDEIASPS
ncbi:myo-inositol 2-dehydrogenase/D-chiro-inositol 1-dehydrogenase [Terracoccus luteus]|uniref:Myo-inositol 2-dehydrogenase/D-chiro-inositol 1-dehydrogenase n=1 Tax=Terracoccus luteus TaxID=53356 RepID=A0A495XYV9_9MICO|nr:Gfo/Idh/MocA family oxidoreductase [Terracoccus luteus]RKT79132.1 myo-inositol 2-dehydrogenase/D-chiro-inositol 1-dehydrogenase [Terracoccus luteus]